MKRGYVLVKVYPDHPLFDAMANNMGYIPEHRLVMAEHLGRPLKRTEVVHHKNGVKTDNRLENLELFTSFQEHGRALHERRPHAGFFPTEFVLRIFLLGLECYLAQAPEDSSIDGQEQNDTSPRCPRQE